MPKRFSRRILNHMADTRYEPRTIRQLARDLNIPDDEYDLFCQAAEQLLEQGDLIRGSEETISLPPPGKEMIGSFRRHERGFGFLVPDELTEHGDLFVPPHQTNDAMTGDRVRAKVFHDPRRGGGSRSPYVGEIVEILERADRRYAGTLFKKGKSHFVEVDGRSWHEPIYIGDPRAKNARQGDKVVVEIANYPGEGGELAEGVITEVLGESGEPDVETRAVMRAFGLKEQFAEPALDEARQAARAFDGEADADTREDCTELFTLTIDPPEARDFDDAITLRKLETNDEGVYELGVHIADVSHFVASGGALDEEAFERGNSAYLPRRVVPMLPELLSNGVCSLQEGVNRYCKSAFITFDAEGQVLAQRFASTVIRSDKRLTYLEAQALIDNDLREARKHAATEPTYSRQLSEKLQFADELARLIHARRKGQGMIALALPEVELIFDDSGRVVDAQPEDDAYTHTIIEMFMVEANEAAARLFEAYRIPMIRRVHPDPDAHDLGDLQSFARVAGYNIPANPDRKQLQQLLDSVRGKPAEHAVHLAVLKTLSKAEYAPLLIGHFALASEHYTHFTSPIRRYPDLVVHRGLEAMLAVNHYKPLTAGLQFVSNKEARRMQRGVEEDHRLPDEQRLQEIGSHCSATERNAESAERELRNYLLLEMLSDHLGEDYEGTATGVVGSGLFVELDRFLVDGFVPVAELPTAKGDRWQLNPSTGALVAQRSGKTINIGDRFVVRIAQIDLSRRRMELVVVEQTAARSQQGEAGLPDQTGQGKGKKSASGKKKSGKRRQSKGAAAAHGKSQKLKQQQKGDEQKNRADDGRHSKSTKKRSKRGGNKSSQRRSNGPSNKRRKG
jgi:ribonuclease R